MEYGNEKMKSVKEMVKLEESQTNQNIEKMIGGVLELVSQDTRLWGMISGSCEGNKERIQLLQDILRDCRQKEAGELTSQIYQYGSMLKEQDLLARQIFLWLSVMIERNELCTDN